MKKKGKLLQMEETRRSDNSRGKRKGDMNSAEKGVWVAKKKKKYVVNLGPSQGGSG